LQTSHLILDFEFDQHLESHKHVISIIIGFRDTGCYRISMPKGMVGLSSASLSRINGQWCGQSHGFIFMSHASGALEEEKTSTFYICG
jgi:hypothetical protein